MTFQEDQLAVLDLLLRKYCFTTPRNNNSKTRINIFSDDLYGYKLTPEIFAGVIEYFHTSGIKIISIGDDDDINIYFLSEDQSGEPTRFEVDLPHHFLDVQKKLINSINTTQPANSTEIDFDPQTGILRYGGLYKKFQMHSKKGCIPFKLFSILWDFKKDKLISKDGILPAELAVQLNLISSSKHYLRNCKASTAIENAIKTIRKKLKGFPAKLERHGGIQLVIS